MYHDGRKFKRSKKYSWRIPVTGDIDEDGRQLSTAEFTIVRRKDCNTYVDEKSGRTYLNTKDAPQAVKLGYGGTYYGYGPVRKYGNHWVVTTYLVNDNKVYVGRRKFPTDPRLK